jgi:ABC-type transporter Mla subunit MlaD
MAFSTELKVGSLFFIGLGLSVWFTFQTTKTSNGVGDLTVDFRRVARLAPGDPVLYNGVRVGKVASVSPVIEDGAPRVQVAFSIDPTARAAVLVDKDSLVRINQGLLGGAAMEIMSSGGEPATRESVAHIPTSDPASFDEVMRSMQDILDENRDGLRGTISSARTSLDSFAGASQEIRDAVAENRATLKQTIVNAERLTAEIQAIAAENRDTVKQTVANAERMTREIADLVAENRDTVKAALARIEAAGAQVAALIEENRKNIQATTDRLPGAVDNLAAAAGQIRDAVAENREDLRSTMMGIAAFAPKLDRIGDNLEKVTAQVAAGKGTIGKLVMEDTIHDQASTVLTSAQERLEEIKPFTQGVSQLKIFAGIEGGGNLTSGAGRGEAYLRIEPQSWKLYQFGLSYRTAPSDRKVVADNPDKLGVDFNAVFGWRFLPDDDIERYRLTLAGGVVESKLGFWSEWAISDRVDLRLMARQKDSDRESNDRRYERGDVMLRATMSWRVYDRWTLIAGADDILGEDVGPFVGLRAELLDNDLRNAVSAASFAQ